MIVVLFPLALLSPPFPLCFSQLDLVATPRLVVFVLYFATTTSQKCGGRLIYQHIDTVALSAWLPWEQSKNALNYYKATSHSGCWDQYPLLLCQLVNRQQLVVDCSLG
jgi:hypothetical protein